MLLVLPELLADGALELELLAEGLADELADQGLDACTLNNALNVAQLIALVAVIRWLRHGDEQRDRPKA